MVSWFSMKKWGRGLLLFLLMLALALTIFQRRHKQVNLALRLKEISNREKPTSIINKLKLKKNVQLQAQEKLEEGEVKTDSIDSKEILDLRDVDNNLDSANNVLENEPDNFDALRLKLKMLLIKEQKFKQAIDDDEINKLLEKLVALDSEVDVVTRQEAAIRSVYSSERETLVSKAQMMAEELWFLQNDYENVDRSLIENRIFEIEKINQQISLLDLQNEVDLQNNELSSQENLIEIPLYRLLFKNQLSEVIDDSLELIERYPHFLSGYYFLVRALDMSGDSAAANEILQISPLSMSEHQLLRQRLNRPLERELAEFWNSL